MESLLAKIGAQAMNMAIRSSLGLTSAYAFSQYSRLLATIEDGDVFQELKALEAKLESKIKIIGPAIDLIELRSKRGNIFLESALPLARQLQNDITSLGRRLESAASITETQAQKVSSSMLTSGTQTHQVEQVLSDLRSLLDDIDCNIPLLQLAITASGESLSASLPNNVSPSRLLQASTLLIMGDTRYVEATTPFTIGPDFRLSIYMSFLGHTKVNCMPNVLDSSNVGSPSDSKPVWQEVIHKARVRIIRLPFETRFDHIRGYLVGNSCGYIASEYVYHLEVIEDLDDGRLHESPNGARNYQEIAKAGIRESIPLHQISKIFYTDTGRLLNIGSEDSLCNKPVLLLKRDTKAQSTESRVLDHSKWSFGEKAQAKRDSCNMDLSVQHREQGTIDMADDLQLDLQIRNEASLCHNKSRAEFCFPPHLDPEWIALEVFEDGAEGGEDEEDEAEGADKGDEDDEEDPDASDSSSQSQKSLEKVLPRGSSFLCKLKNMSLAANLPGAKTHNSQSQVSSVPAQQQRAVRLQPTPSPQPPPQPKDLVSGGPFNAIKTSLSLMEMLIRLAGLQEFQQMCHLSIPDHLLTFFLEQSSTTGLTGLNQQKVREEARRRVGFDPYTDTPTNND
ncbi:Ran-specific GTPase-activating protein 30 [Ceratocystis pirilliformis]|uniref:Ran-specific GTPase-activating protein 30 n=1 Tax=Ceratocystis pirilliformis TaxID=259994 RepID=A0ABR3ZQC8_9PEZI